MVRKNQRVAVVSTINTCTQCSVVNLSQQLTNSNANNNIHDASEKHSAPSRQCLEQFARDYGFNISADLTDTQRQTLLTLLYKYKHTFARSFADIKGYKGAQLELQTKPHRPFNARQFKMNETDRIEAQRQIDELKAYGLVEPATSGLYSSPIFMVAKANGTRRLITDLRFINQSVLGLNLQLPAVYNLVEQVAQSRPAYMTSLDLFSGYFQTSVAPASRPLLSFTSPQ